MTENDEKLAEELSKKASSYYLPTQGGYYCAPDLDMQKGFKKGFLAGLAHERAKSQKLVEWAKRAIKGPEKIHLVYPRCDCDECNPTQGLEKALEQFDEFMKRIEK